MILYKSLEIQQATTVSLTQNLILYLLEAKNLKFDISDTDLRTH